MIRTLVALCILGLGALPSASAQVASNPDPTLPPSAIDSLSASLPSSEEPSPLHFRSPLLKEAHRYLLERSWAYREDAERILSRSDFRVEIGYRDDYAELTSDPTDAAILPVTLSPAPAPFVDDRPLPTYRIVLYTSPYETLAHSNGYPRENLVRERAIILAHELYGHVFPMVDDDPGKFPGPCGDPVKGQAVLDSCAVQRENVIRRELGLPERTTYSPRELGFLRYALSILELRPSP